MLSLRLFFGSVLMLALLSCGDMGRTGAESESKLDSKGARGEYATRIRLEEGHYEGSLRSTQITSMWLFAEETTVDKIPAGLTPVTWNTEDGEQTFSAYIDSKYSLILVSDHPFDWIGDKELRRELGERVNVDWL